MNADTGSSRELQRCRHEDGVCHDTSHQGIGGEADREWFAAQRDSVAENRLRAALDAADGD